HSTGRDVRVGRHRNKPIYRNRQRPRHSRRISAIILSDATYKQRAAGATWRNFRGGDTRMADLQVGGAVVYNRAVRAGQGELAARGNHITEAAAGRLT